MMKKIIVCSLLVFSFCFSYSFGECTLRSCDLECDTWPGLSTDGSISSSCLPCENSARNDYNTCKAAEAAAEAAKIASWVAARQAAQNAMGIRLDTDCMKGVGCSMDVAKVLGLKAPTSTEDRTSVLTFVQDVVLGATYFIGTIVALAFIFSGLLFVFSAADSSKRKLATSWMTNAAIGLVLVVGSYVIIRFIQFLASGG